MNLLQDGYVVDVPYPTFVHRQTMPVWLKTIVNFQGFVTPDISKPYRYLELGCAMGIHLHLTAAANPLGHFVGVDFNRQQLMVAQEGLEQTKIENLEFIHASFSELLATNQEPFDFIITHGVWSWISKENQNIILEIVNKLLKPNGIFYISYMSHPGATGLTSIQKLMFEMSKNLKGDSVQKAAQSLSLVRQISQSNVGLFAEIPSLHRELTELAKDKPSYTAHDFLSQHWQPQHSADMIRLFGEIGLSYTAGAGIMENMDRLTLPPEIRQTLKNLPLITLQETVKDIARYTLQRQDIYVKSRMKLDAKLHSEIQQQIQFGLLPSAPIHQNLSKDPKIGKIKDVIPVFEKILFHLKDNNLNIIQLDKVLNIKLTLDQLSDIILVLVWAGYIHPIRPDATQSKSEEETNRWIHNQNLPWLCLSMFGTSIQI